MPTINVTVRNRIATAQRWQCIICGNSDYIVDFDLDDEWNDMPNKVAVFVTNTRGNIRHERVLFDGSTCGIPVLRGVNMVDIGIEAGDIRTTTPAHVKCEACITDRAGMPQEPENNVYGQILAMTTDIAQAVIAASEQAESAQTAASAAARDAQTTRTAASAAASSAQTAQECAQAMAGTFDFTGYMRYRVVTELPEQQDDNVLYLIVDPETPEGENGGTLE
ncbi:MAG: hypothetical protein ACI4NK_00300 [Christensenellales bacterium]|jgi:hypothetical protein|nr:MAG TPA: hypothetical protein [Caudoviricetes sp.]DAZ08795.1 MAG TPA: hypothetical protein [Caudoviricetes sp.]